MFLRGSLVIGFELPEVLTQWLSRIGIVFLDFCICPLQFMDDIALAICSNSSAISSRLATCGLSKDQCFAYADVLKATLQHAAYYKPPLPEALFSSANLFCAGYHKDRNLAGDGRFWNYRDFTSEVLRLAEHNCHSWFKPHPWAGSTSEDEVFFAQLVKAETTKRNIYEVFSVAPKLNVISLCSSTTLEAEFFGHSGVNLVGPPAELYYANSGAPPKGAERIIILHDVWDSQFWSRILGIYNSRGPRVVLDRRPNRLRNIIGFFGPAVAIDLVPQSRAMQNYIET